MKRILITGGAGFVGSNIAKALVKEHEIFIVDNLSFGSKKNLDTDILTTHFLNDDFNNIPVVFLNSFDILIHCATVNINYAIQHPIETFKVNALNTIDLFRRFKGKIIYTSTSSVYGQADEFPTKETAEMRVFNAYDQSKLIAERYLKLRGNYTTLRLSNVYGINQRPDNPYSGVVAKFIYEMMLDHKVEIFGDGEATRDYTHIKDVVRAIEMAIEGGGYAYNMTFNISGSNEVSTIGLVKKIAILLDKEGYFINKPNRAIDKISRRLLDTSLIEKHLGWTPKVAFNDGLTHTIEWIKEEYEIGL